MSGLFRTERTYVLSDAQAAHIEGVIAGELPARTYAGAHECRIRTVYLDSKDGFFARSIVNNPSRSTKLRVRSYYPGEPLRDPPVWVEVKHRRGLVVAKSRFETTRAALPAVLRGGTPPDAPEQQELARVRGIRSLIPTVIVDYRRRSYETPDGGLRLTFDGDVSAGRASADYFARAQLAPHQISGWQALGDSRIFEVKLRGSVPRMPRWLGSLLLGLQPDGFSKAAAAFRSVAAPESGSYAPVA
jgi:hypothetical protein